MSKTRGGFDFDMIPTRDDHGCGRATGLGNRERKGIGHARHAWLFALLSSLHQVDSESQYRDDGMTEGDVVWWARRVAMS